MDISEYRESLFNSLRSAASVDGSSTENEFLDHVAEMLVDAGELEEYSLCLDGRDSAGRWRVDGSSLDLAMGELNLLLSLYEEAPSYLTNGKIEDIAKKGGRFLENVLGRNPYEFFSDGTNAQGLAIEIRDHWPALKRINLFVISNCALSHRVKSVAGSDVAGVPISFKIWDFTRIHALEVSSLDREDLHIDLSAKPLPCLMANLGEEGTQSYLAIMSALQLVRLFQDWKSRLLEQNVRSFLQFKARGVNAGIKETITNEPQLFFAYNNGLTTTAEAVDIDTSGKTTMIRSIKNFQIVNGGQTTASLYHAWREGLDISKISIQMKLTVVEPHKVDSIVPSIARFANRQNAINAADLFSSHPFHAEMERISRRLLPPRRADSDVQVSERWFYERSRGQYYNEMIELTPAKKRQFKLENPRTQLITKTDLALSENTWACKPVTVSKGAQFNIRPFAEELVVPYWTEDKSKFDEGYFKAAVCKMLIARTLRRQVMASDWYGGYPANIVSYTVAWFALNLADAGLEVDFGIVWSTQEAPAVLMAELLAMARSVNQHIQETDKNVTTYCKTEKCWDEAKKRLPRFNLAGLDSVLRSEKSSTATVSAPASDDEQNEISDDQRRELFRAMNDERWEGLLVSMDREGQLFPRRHKNILKLKAKRKVSKEAEESLEPFLRSYLESLD